MVFSSTVFLFIFLPAVYALLNLLPGIKLKNALLLISGIVFYGWGEPAFLPLLLLSALINYLLAFPAEKGRRRAGRLALAAALAYDLGTLLFFKYLPFSTARLPIGISFYTFQALGYVIDVYRGDVRPQKSFFRLLLYISFFPQLIAGPIVRYGDIEKQLSERTVTAESTAAGMKRFIFGLTKKLLIANGAGMIADAVYGLDAALLSAPTAWLGAAAYMIQIYFDFSGYSDMALGLGKMAGFDLKENFLYPYTARSARDFWKRWHVSLSSWLRDYVYIPLGGSRKGQTRAAVNRMIVFLLCGLWHGGTWTFLLWGAWHGLLLMLETYGVIRPEKMGRTLSGIYLLLSVGLGFVLFRAESLSQAGEILRSMFTGFAINEQTIAAFFTSAQPFPLFCLALGAVFSAPVLRKLYVTDGSAGEKAELLGYIVSVPMYALCILLAVSSSYDPFIYFRF